MAQILSVCEKGKSKHFPPPTPLKTERRREKFTRASVDTSDKSRACACAYAGSRAEQRCASVCCWIAVLIRHVLSVWCPPRIFLYPCKMCHVFSSEIINNCVFLMANRMLNYFFLIPWQCSRLQAKTSLMKWIWCKENFGGWADFTILLHVKQPWESKVKWGEEKWSEYRCTVCLLRFRDEGAGRLTLTTELRRRAAQVWGCFTNIRVSYKAS